MSAEISGWGIWGNIPENLVYENGTKGFFAMLSTDCLDLYTTI